MLRKIKRLRVTTILSNLKNLYKLKSNAPLYKKYDIKKKPWQLLSYDSIKQHGTDLPWLDQPVNEQAIRDQPLFKTFSSHLQEQILQWPEKGFIVLPGFFKKEDIEETEQSITKNLSKKELQEYLSDRLVNLNKKNEDVDRIFKDAELLRILSFILGRQVTPFQTINFCYSGSQAAHSDTIHLTTEPLGYLVGVWVALEDVVAGSGEFFYYPGSHKLHYILNHDLAPKNHRLKHYDDLHEKYEKKIAEMIAEKNLPDETYLPKKGDILIWHANLIHGSRPKSDPSLTRKSLIMHYFAQGVLCYHELLEKPAVFS